MKSIIIVVICSALTTACDLDDTGRRGSEISRPALVIEYRPVCGQDNTIWLEATISNDSAREVRVPNGALPWHYDGVGTEFSMSRSDGQPLKRRDYYATNQQIGPESLRPKELKKGRLPIEFLFPGAGVATKIQPITFRWAYWIDVRDKGSKNMFSGNLKLSDNPCNKD